LLNAYEGDFEEEEAIRIYVYNVMGFICRTFDASYPDTYVLTIMSMHIQYGLKVCDDGLIIVLMYIQVCAVVTYKY
jgi:hypothetical protein